MNLRTQDLPIDNEKPFEHDFFGRRFFATKLNDILTSTSGVTVFVHSPWGHGKSTFVKQWRQSLLNDGIEISVLDAFSKDYISDSFLLFMSEIESLIDTVISRKEDEYQQEEKREKLKKLMRSTVQGSSKLALSFAKHTAKKFLGDIVDEWGDNTLGEATGEVADEEIDKLAQKYKSKIDELSEDKNLIDDFKENLTWLALEFKENNEGFPLTIVIDELDRCRPDFALALLEKMKHFFNVENVNFVIMADKVQLSQHVSHAYGLSSSDMGYISKFGDVFTSLPTKEVKSVDSGSAYMYFIYHWTCLLYTSPSPRDRG